MRDDALASLEALGVIERGTNGHRTTKKWQAAMARAALRLMRAGDASDDLRVPVAAALLELCGEVPGDELADLVMAMLPIESAELDVRRATSNR